MGVEIAARFTDAGQAASARAEWERIHSSEKRGLPDDIPEFAFPKAEIKEGRAGLLTALKLAGLAPSTSEARRLVEGGGVHLILADHSEQKIADPKYTLEQGEHVFRVGKRKFVKMSV